MEDEENGQKRGRTMMRREGRGEREESGGGKGRGRMSWVCGENDVHPG